MAGRPLWQERETSESGRGGPNHFGPPRDGFAQSRSLAAACYFFIAALNGSFTFGKLAIVTLTSLPFTFSTLRI